MSVFDLTNTTPHDARTCFFGGPVNVARYEKVRYPFFEKLIERQLGYFWRPQEVELTRDARDFKMLNPHEQHIFTSNLKRQILLDSVQGRAPTAAFGPLASLPEIEAWIQWWAAMEIIHSRSYTHIIRNVYPDPSQVLDGMLDIQEIVDCAKDISVSYDRLIAFNENLAPYDGTAMQYEHKKALWLALNSVNVLEGIRFYVSFACSWAFAERGQMVGNGSVIKLIARDENLHLAGTQKMLSILPEEDEAFKQIRFETEDQTLQMFAQAIDQEKKWAQYLFQDGSIIGLNEQMLSQYVDWIAAKRMKTIGLQTFTPRNRPNPLPWTEKWIGGSDVQVAPQETVIESYQVSAIKQDLTADTFANFTF